MFARSSKLPCPYLHTHVQRHTHCSLCFSVPEWAGSEIINTRVTATTKRALYYTHMVLFSVFSRVCSSWSLPPGRQHLERDKDLSHVNRPIQEGHPATSTLVLSPGQGPSALITARPGPRQPAAAAEPCVYSDQPVWSLLALPRLTLPTETTTKTYPHLLPHSLCLIDPMALCGIPCPLSQGIFFFHYSYSCVSLSSRLWLRQMQVHHKSDIK